jgi:hypothetical protein
MNDELAKALKAKSYARDRFILGLDTEQCSYDVLKEDYPLKERRQIKNKLEQQYKQQETKDRCCERITSSASFPSVPPHQANDT